MADENSKIYEGGGESELEITSFTRDFLFLKVKILVSRTLFFCSVGKL